MNLKCITSRFFLSLLLLCFSIVIKVRQSRNDFIKLTFLPKNERKNSTLLLCDLFSFVFWKKLKIPKRHFEINWPLVLLPFFNSVVYLLDLSRIYTPRGCDRSIITFRDLPTSSIIAAWLVGGVNTHYMRNPTMVYPVKMEYGWNFWLKVS